MSVQTNVLQSPLYEAYMNKDELCDCEIIHEETVKKVKATFPQDEMIFDLADFYKIFGDTRRNRSLRRWFSNSTTFRRATATFLLYSGQARKGSRPGTQTVHLSRRTPAQEGSA